VKTLPWGDSPYDAKSPREVVDDYVLTRGDLVDDHAREQLANWIERYAEHKATEALATATKALEPVSEAISEALPPTEVEAGDEK
jgi:hypothetical protein